MLTHLKYPEYNKEEFFIVCAPHSKQYHNIAYNSYNIIWQSIILTYYVTSNTYMSQKTRPSLFQMACRPKAII